MVESYESKEKYKYSFRDFVNFLIVIYWLSSNFLSTWMSAVNLF